MLIIVDIDECAQGTAGCHQGCRNTDGGFICTCDEGYQTHHSDPSYCVGMSGMSGMSVIRSRGENNFSKVASQMSDWLYG